MFVISFYDMFLQAKNFYMLLNNEGESMFCCHIYSVQILNLSNECFKNSRCINKNCIYIVSKLK